MIMMSSIPLNMANKDGKSLNKNNYIEADNTKRIKK
jgi:hypothetical protein